jgi:hypothetical protein
MIINEFLVAVDVTKIHPRIRPAEIMISGAIFMYRGRINIDVLIGDSQDIVLPAQIDIMDNITIGIIIFVFSEILIILDLE